MREKLKEIWRNILTKSYSEDTVSAIMYLLAKTCEPEKTLDQIFEILNMDLTNELTYSKLTELIK